MKNKEYKFRIWHKIEKKFFPSDGTDLRMDGKQIKLICEWDGIVQYPFENIIISQYLNIKDKNNKEIFDYDIVKVNDLYLVAGADLKFEYYSKKEEREVVGNIFTSPDELLNKTVRFNEIKRFLKV